MSFNIKSSFVSRAIVQNDNEEQIESDNNQDQGVVVQEAYDPRTLYERLQEQKALKEEEFAEKSRLSNQIKRVDEEEAEYFRVLSDEREKVEHQRKITEQLELEEYRQAVENARSSSASQIPVLDSAATTVHTTIAHSVKPKTASVATSSKKKLLKGALLIKKKKSSEDKDTNSDDEEEDEKVDSSKKRKLDNDDSKEGKKQKVNSNPLSLLSAYGDASSSSSSEDEA